MRILYYAPIDPSLSLGHAVHVRHLVEELEARGHEFRTVCLQPSAPLGPWPSRGGLATYERKGPPILRQMGAEVRAAILLRKVRCTFAPDLVILRQEQLSVAPLFLASDRPTVVESNSSLPAVARASGASPGRVNLVSFTEGALLRRASVVVVVSDRLQRIQVRRHRLEQTRVEVIPNGTVLPNVISRDTCLRLRAERGVREDQFVAAFVGNLQRQQGLDLVLYALARLPEGKRFRLWIIGQGVDQRSLQDQARRLGVFPCVDFFGAMSEERSASAAQAAQLLLAPYGRAAFEETGIDPLKVLQGLACDRPLLVPDLTDLKWVEEIGAGRTVPEETPESWAKVCESWMERWREAGRPLTGWPWPAREGPGYQFIRDHRTWGHTADAWERLLLGILDPHHS